MIEPKSEEHEPKGRRPISKVLSHKLTAPNTALLLVPEHEDLVPMVVEPEERRLNLVIPLDYEFVKQEVVLKSDIAENWKFCGNG